MPAAQLAPQRAFLVASHWRRPRPTLLRGLGLPVGDELAVCVLGLFGELALAAADLGEVVRGGLAFLASVGGHPGAELERAELLLGQRRAARTRSPRP